MMKLLSIACLLSIGLAALPAIAGPFKPGVPGRSDKEVCRSTSAACQKWTELAKKCEANMQQRDTGYMGPQKPYCTQAESLREKATGIGLSTAPGAYAF
jgi:hypothetical protein